MVAFTAAIRLDPSNHLYFYNRGGTYLKLEKWNEAATDLKRSISIKENATAYYLLSEAFYEQGQFQAALDAVTRSSEMTANASRNEHMFVRLLQKLSFKPVPTPPTKRKKC